MKRRLLFCAFNILSIASFSQTTLTGDRVVAKSGLYVKDKWIDSIQASGAFGSNRTIPTSKAVDYFFKLRGQDSSIIFYLPNKYAMGQKFNQLVLSNTGKDSIPTVYQATSGIQNGPYNQASLLINRKFNEAKNDTLNLQYGGAVVAYNEHRYDSVSNRFKAETKAIVLPYGGFYSDNRFYAPRDSVDVFAGTDGQNAAGVAAALSIGDTWGYNYHIYSLSSRPKYPLALFKGALDVQRNFSYGRQRKMTGNGIAIYLADWKSYQASINPATVEEGSYQSKIVDFFSYGDKDNNAGSTATKAKIMKVSKVDTAIGFYSMPKYTDVNEVYNGYGFVQDGADDYNYFQGRLKIGGVMPSRDAGGIAQSLVVSGSTYSDSVVTKVLKGAVNVINVDSLTSLKMTAKVGVAGGNYMLEMKSNLDSTETESNVAGGVRVYRNWGDFKTNGRFESPFDARDYYNIGANRSVTFGACATCLPNVQYNGYKQIIAGDGVTVSSLSSSLKPTIYLARNEIRSSSSTNKVKATDLEIVGYTAQVLTGPNTDTIGGYVAFKDIGVTLSGANKVLNYYAFKTDVTNVADNTYGFYQGQPNVKNYLAGSLKLGDVLNLPSTTAPSSSSDTSGSDGDLKRDSAGNIYLKAGSSWLKFSGVTF